MDRLKQYFTDKLDDMFFVELSPEFVDKAGAGNYLRDVPVPIHKKDLPGFAGGKGMETAKLGERMTEVIGCDPEFKYSENYLAFLKHAFDDKLIEVLLGRAARQTQGAVGARGLRAARPFLARRKREPAFSSQTNPPAGGAAAGRAGRPRIVAVCMADRGARQPEAQPRRDPARALRLRVFGRQLLAGDGYRAPA